MDVAGPKPGFGVFLRFGFLLWLLGFWGIGKVIIVVLVHLGFAIIGKVISTVVGWEVWDTKRQPETDNLPRVTGKRGRRGG